MNDWETFCLRPGSHRAEGPWIKEKGLGELVKAAIYILLFPLSEESRPMSGIRRNWTVYLWSAETRFSFFTPLSPCPWKYSGLIQPPWPPALRVAPAVRASAVTWHWFAARVFLSLRLSVQSAKSYCSITLLGLKGFQVCWDCAWAKIWVYGVLGLV